MALLLASVPLLHHPFRVVPLRNPSAILNPSAVPHRSSVGPSIAFLAKGWNQRDAFCVYKRVAIRYLAHCEPQIPYDQPTSTTSSAHTMQYTSPERHPNFPSSHSVISSSTHSSALSLAPWSLDATSLVPADIPGPVYLAQDVYSTDLAGHPSRHDADHFDPVRPIILVH